MKHALLLAALASTAASPGIVHAADSDMAISAAHIESAHPYRGHASPRSDVVWARTVVEPGASELSVYFSRLELGAGDFVVVTNGEDELVLTNANAGQWTQPLLGSALRIELHSDGGPGAYGVSIDRLRAAYAPDPTMSIYQRNDLLWIAEAPDAVYAERGPTARLYITGVGYCTGFLFGEDLFMTNNHCVSSAATCAGAVAQFNYENDEDGRPLPSDDYQCSEMVTTNATLDYTVLRLADGPGATYGWYDLEHRTPTDGEQGTIIQHPNASRKQAAVAPNCLLGAVTAGNGPNTDFKHQCDTAGGSSGAPVLDADFQVIGIHHFGGAGKVPRTWNQAVRMDSIMDDCRACAAP